jgi:hypothetical protein
MFKIILYNGKETDYEVSQEGCIRNRKTTHIMSQQINNGYFRTRLYIEKRYKYLSSHRLVAEAFIKNLDNLPDVNHKDKNRQNNSVENLKWATRSDNCKHSKDRKNNGRQVLQYDKKGDLIKSFESISEAGHSLSGNPRSNGNGIMKCANDNLKYYKNFVWKYGENNYDMIYEQDSNIKHKPIPGFDNYEAYSNGKIGSIRSAKYLKPSIVSGYYMVTLCKKNKQYTKSVHRIIAETFISNPGNKTLVNHKNCNKLDNRLENLEWVTPSENSIHACVNNLNTREKSVEQYSKKGELLNTYRSIRAAARAVNKPKNGDSSIIYACQGKIKTAYGFLWKYASDTVTEPHSSTT